MSAVDRSGPPPAGPLRPFHVPPLERRVVGADLPLLTVHMPRLPVVTASLVLRGAGESALPVAEAGLASLTADALDGGTQRRSGSALAEALEAVGADAGVAAGWDSTTATVSGPADLWAEGLDLLLEMVLAPDFPADEVERCRDQALAQLRQRNDDPAALATVAAAALAYADGEPYARPLRGTRASLEAAGRAELVRWADERYRPAVAGLVVVGDIDAGEVERVAAELLAGWSGAAPLPPPPGGRARFGHRTLHLIHRPGSVQSEVRLAHPGATRSTPDHAALVVGNSVLGGTFGSRLNMNLREARGFTYGVRSGFAFRRGPGPFSVATAVDTAVTAEAVAEAVREVERYHRDGPTDDEVRSARDYLAGVFPLGLETTGRVAARVAQLFVHDLPDAAWTGYRDEIRGVQRDEAHAAIRRHLKPAELTIVVVGDADAVAADLEALELGPVTVHDGRDLPYLDLDLDLDLDGG